MLLKVIKDPKKVLCILILFTVIFSLFAMFIDTNKIYATSNRYTYDGNNIDTNLYPGFKEKIDNIKSAHPNWNIVIMETGLDWNQVLVAESSFTGSSPYSLIQGKSGAWVCSSCGTKAYDNGSWYHASEAAISYYMDPRNWMEPNSSTILQFLQIGWVETTDENIYNAIKGTFLDKDDQGMENAKAINRASKENNANPFYVVARIIQEQGINGGATYKMSSDDKFYYNIFNIGASGNGSSQIIANALAKAKANDWDSLEKSISGGIKVLFSDYINQKQDTIYLNKFDVESYKGLYHQYMQNIEAPKSESTLMYNKIKDSGILNQALTFVIPVFLNMPQKNSASPDTMSELGPINIRVKAGHSDIIVRESRSTSSKQVTTLKDSSINVLSVERFGDGWHKIILENGTEGYVYFNSNYLEEVNDVTNCDEGVIINGDGAELKAGPKSNQKTITNIANGQSLTRIDNSGRYTFDGKVWDRVKLSDGKQGFVMRDYLQLETEASNVFTIRAEGGLYLRSEPNGTAIRLLADGSKVTRTEIGNSLVNGYYWDKVTTSSGAVGYVARSYLRDKDGNVPSGVQTDILTNVKKDDDKSKVLVEPDVTAETLKEKYSNAKITKPDGTEVSSGVIGTGYKIEVNSKSYTVIKMGDSSGDGKINSADLLKIQKHLLKVNDITNTPYFEASDVTGDGKINSADLLKIQKYLLNVSDIKI